jgi:ABC-type glycerol-3-phosphate transport system substrate-binding protein
VLEELIKRFEAENPNTRVKLVTMPWGGALDKMVASILAKNPPDLSTVGQGWAQTLAGTGGILSLDDIIARLGGADAFVGTSLTVLGSLNDKVWSAPLYITPHGFFYRKSWFAEAGVQVPTTWEAFTAMAKAITNPAKGRYAWSIPFDIHGGKAVWAWLLSNGVTIYEKGTDGRWKLDFGGPETIETYNFLYQLHKNYAPPGATSYSQKENESLFAAGRMGLYYETPGILKTVKENNPALLEDVGYFSAPPRKRRGSGQGWVGLVVYDTPRAEPAKKFVEFMFRKKNLLDFTLSFPYFHTPAYKPILEAPEYVNALPPELQPIMQQAPEVLAWSAGISLWNGPNPWAGEIEAKMILPKALSRMLVDGWSAEQAVQEAATKLKELME